MSIDISVLVWTIVGFLVLMVILDKLLFRPILEILEKRRQTVEEGLRAGRQAQQQLEEHKKQLSEKLELCRQEETENARREAENVDQALERALDEEELDQMSRRAAEKEIMEADRIRLTEAMERNVSRYGQQLAGKLIVGLQGGERTR